MYTSLLMLSKQVDSCGGGSLWAEQNCAGCISWSCGFSFCSALQPTTSTGTELFFRNCCNKAQWCKNDLPAGSWSSLLEVTSGPNISRGLLTVYILAQYSNERGLVTSYSKHATSHDKSCGRSVSLMPTSISCNWRARRMQGGAKVCSGLYAIQTGEVHQIMTGLNTTGQLTKR